MGDSYTMGVVSALCDSQDPDVRSAAVKAIGRCEADSKSQGAVVHVRVASRLTIYLLAACASPWMCTTATACGRVSKTRMPRCENTPFAPSCTSAHGEGTKHWLHR
jgi:hypothetical protein